MGVLDHDQSPVAATVTHTHLDEGERAPAIGREELFINGEEVNPFDDTMSHGAEVHQQVAVSHLRGPSGTSRRE